MISNINIYSFNQLPATRRFEMAKSISDYSKGLGGEDLQMLPVEPEDVYAKYVGSVAISKKEFAGYCGASLPEVAYGKTFSEVGTLFVVKKYRKSGLGLMLAESITKELINDDIEPYVFANSSSIGIFKKLGYMATPGHRLPPGIFEPCAKCPKNPVNKGCCDTVLAKEGPYESYR